jgi:peptidoglycan hydrolase-like protein with peptidoglycan-binding domain
VSRGRVILAAGVALALASTAIVLALERTAPAPARTVPTATARVVRTDVVERQQAVGTLDFVGNFTVVDGGPSGVATWVPTGGDVVRRGERLFELEGAPVVLLYGAHPAFRAFAFGMSGGADVRDLQRNLDALGFGPIGSTGRFDLATLAAVERWQRRLGEQPTGTLPLGSIVFLPGAIRVATVAATLGAPVQAGAVVLTATATTPAVLVQVDPSQGAQAHVGDRVVVTMPDGSPVPGRVAVVGRVASTPSDSSGGGGGPPPTPMISLTVRLLRNARGAFDQAPVQVAITTAEARHVLAAPVAALLSQPGGGYAVRTVDRRLVPVTTGLFDDVAGIVEVQGVARGTRVEVPAR